MRLKGLDFWKRCSYSILCPQPVLSFGCDWHGLSLGASACATPLAEASSSRPFLFDAAGQVLPEAINDDNIDEFLAMSRRQGRSYPLVYDHVIRCLGWAFDLDMFGSDATPKMQVCASTFHSCSTSISSGST
eukprot:SAG11_NODE_652_length_7925_cov_3.950166_7_plen_132_part_00